MIINDDCRSALSGIESDSIDCCVTSPPYWGLRDYGHRGQLGQESTPTKYVDAIAGVFDQVMRVLSPIGTLWLNIGDSYANHGGGSQGRTGQSSNRAHAKSGVRVMSKSKLVEDLKPKDLCGIPWRVALELQSRGWYLRSSIIWAKSNPMPESVRDRPTKSHEYVFLLSKSETYHYDADAIREKASPRAVKSSSVKHESAAADDDHMRTRANLSSIEPSEFRNSRDVWTMPTQPFAGAHFACMPPDLVARCILAGCPIAGTVLDPFLGSGTTGMVAENLGRKWVGIELNPKYVEIAKERTKQIGMAV